MGSRVRIRLFHILHFVMDFLFPLLKNSKSGVDDRGHRLRSGSPVTNLPGAATHGTFFLPSTKRGLILIGLELNTNARESFEHVH